METIIQRRNLLRAIAGVCVLIICAAGPAKTGAKTAVPVVNAGLGPCTVDFTVSQSLNQPLYNAQISVSIAYGFLGTKKMDLQIGTDSDGKARFEGLPAKVRNPPLTFVVKHHGRTKTVDYWPQVKCQSQYSVLMGAQ